MKPLITADELRRLMPKLSPDLAQLYAPMLDAAMCEHGITTKKRRCAFLAQLAHESSGLTRWQENLNYSAGRLMTVFPNQFKSLAQADAYAHKPEAIANRVYANKNGNGNEASGDGFRFRGRGPIQLTGRNNYRKYGQLLPGSLLEHDPSNAADPRIGFRIAACFWRFNNCNDLADRLNLTGDNADRQVFVQITRRINGGTNGLTDRLNLYRTAAQVLHVDDVAEATQPVTAAPAESPALEPPGETSKPAEPDVDLLDAAVTSNHAKVAGKTIASRLFKHSTAALTFLGGLSEAQKLGVAFFILVLLAGAGWVIYHNRQPLKQKLAKLLKSDA